MTGCGTHSHYDTCGTHSHYDACGTHSHYDTCGTHSHYDTCGTHSHYDTCGTQSLRYMWVTQQLRYKLILNVHGATKRKSVEHSSVQYTLQIGARQDHLRGSFTVHTTNRSTSRSPQRVFHSQPDSVHPYSQKEPLRKALQMLSR